MKLLIKKLINPIELIRAYKFHKKQKKHIKSSQDLELMLYSKIIKTDKIQNLLELLNLKKFKIQVENLGGYNTKHMGKLIETIG